METQEKPKKSISVILFHLWPLFTFEALLFSLTLGLGIANALKIKKIFEIQKIIFPELSSGKILSYFLLSTLFVIFISFFLKLKKEKALIFRAIFISSIFFGGILSLNLWLPDIISFGLIIALIYWWWEKPTILIQDLLIILGIAGAGSLLGLSIKPQVVIFLLIVFSIYDFLAVYKTKHMVKIAKEMVESRAILGLVAPSKLSGFKAGLKEVKPGGRFLILGGGDVISPLLLSASLVPFNILDSLIVALFALIGLFFSFWFFISQKTRQPIPALPPIALFSIIGFLITKLVL